MEEPMEERPLSRVSFSRGEHDTREFDGAGTELAEAASLPNISAGSSAAAAAAGGGASSQRRRKGGKRSRRARKAPARPAGSQVGTVGGACTGRGLPRVSTSASFPGQLEPLGLDSSGLGQGISFSASARDWDHEGVGPEGEEEWSGMGMRPLPAAVMDMPTRLFTRESDLIAAEKRYTDHVSHVHKATRMIDVHTPHGYRDYHDRHVNAGRSSDGIHKFLARRGMASSLAPLSKMTIKPPRSGIYRPVDPDAAAMDDFYAQMQAIEQQMHQSPLCLAHEVMARLGHQAPDLDDEAAYVDAAATRIQAVARGKKTRKQLAEEEAAARIIQARVRGFQTRSEMREQAIKKANAAADAAAAVFAKEEAEAVAAEAAHAKEEAEAVAAEAAHAKEETEAVAAEAAHAKEEAEAVAGEAAHAKEEAEAVAAEADADKEEEEARVAKTIANKETDEADAAQAVASKEEEEERLAAESALKEEEEARLAAETAGKEQAEADAARAAQEKEEEEARLAQERKAKEEADVIAAEKVLADAVASGDETAIAVATAALQKEKDEAVKAAAEAQREEEEAAAAKAEAEREEAEAKQAAESAAKEKAEAEEAAAILAKEKAEADEARIIAEKEQAEADDANAVADREQAEAEEARKIAEKERAEAEEAAIVAERERAEAEEAKIIAERERAEADEAKIVAERERAEADAAKIVAERERAEADAANAEADRTAAIAKALEDEADEEKFAHQAALASVTMPDNPPPENFIKKKKKGFGRSLLKVLGGAKDKGLPPGLHVRLMGTSRPTPSYGDSAMLVTIEIRGALNIKGLMPALLVQHRLAKPYVTMQLAPTAQRPDPAGNTARAAVSAFTTNTAAVSADADGLTWNTSFLVEAEDVKAQQLVGGIYLEAEKSGGHEPKVVGFTMDMGALVPNEPIDAWVELSAAPPTLHLRVAKIVTPGATKLMVDVLDAYGDLDCGEIPDPYVKLHMEAGGQSEDRSSQVVDNDMTPSWNESFIFNCASADDDGPALLTCSIWDKDVVGADDLLGQFTYDASQVGVGQDPVDVWLESTTHSVMKSLIGK